MLQKPLNKGDVVTVIFVNLRRVPFTEAVSAYSVIAEVVTDDGELLLYGSFRDGENQLILLYTVTQTIIFYVLLNDERDGEDASLAGFLLCNLKSVSVSIANNA